MKNNIKITDIKMVEMEDPEYFAHPALSNSKIGLLKSSLKEFLEGFPQSYSPALELGSAVHQRMLEPHKYSLSDVRRPTGMVGQIIKDAAKLTKENPSISYADAVFRAAEMNNYYNGNIGATRLNNLMETGKEFFNYCMNPDCEHCLTEAQVQILNACCTAINNNREAYTLLNPDNLFTNQEVIFEKAFFGNIDVEFEDQFVPVNVKMKADAININHDDKIFTLIDLKTTGSNVTSFGGQYITVQAEDGSDRHVWQDGSFQKFSYYRQMAMYLYLVKHYFIKEGIVDNTWKFQTKMIVVGTRMPSECSVFTVTNDWIRHGFIEFMDYMDDFAYYTVNGFETERIREI